MGQKKSDNILAGLATRPRCISVTPYYYVNTELITHLRRSTEAFFYGFRFTQSPSDEMRDVGAVNEE